MRLHIAWSHNLPAWKADVDNALRLSPDWELQPGMTLPPHLPKTLGHDVVSWKAPPLHFLVRPVAFLSLSPPKGSNPHV